jgi:diguanylate cyclase (GGDEF)-like protein
MSTRPRQRLDANELEGPDGKPLRTRHVAVVLFEGFDLLSASVIANTLELASELSSRSSIQWVYRVAVLAAHDGHVGSSATLLVSTEAFDTRRDYEFDAIFAIVGADTDLDDRSQPLTAWISRARAKAADVRLVGAPLPGPDSAIRDGPRATHHESCSAAGHANDCKRKSQSLHDALTGALSRRYFLDLLRHEIDRAHAAGEPLCMAIADLDHFKQINDTHGHIVGDIVLQEVARRLDSAVRGYDAVGRYGGEEFLILLNDCNQSILQARSEDIRLRMSSTPIQANDSIVPVTISIGAATCDDCESQLPMERLLARADAALYEAKRQGRNRAVLANSVVMS